MSQVPAIAGSSPEAIAAQLAKVRATANELKLRASDLVEKRNQLIEQRANLGSNMSRAALDKQIANLQHDIVASSIKLETANQEIEELQTQRDMARAFSLQVPQPPQPPQPPQLLQGPVGIATTAPPAETFPRPNDIMAILGGGAVLMFPLVLVLARRLWVRGTPRTTVDLENSPRLQRIEQSVEAIAVEVERIGEAQRFTTKLLSERQPEAAARIGVAPRREPGTITPH